jgi:peptidyl-prolyl cis-trans isomerase-like 2
VEGGRLKKRAAALAALLARKEKDDSKSEKEPKHQPFSIVDAASASVHGRSATAAKDSSAEKTAARIAMHMAGDRAPVNAKLVYRLPILLSCVILPISLCLVIEAIQWFQVKSRYTTGAASRSFTSTAYDPVTENEFEYVKVEKNPKRKDMFSCIQPMVIWIWSFIVI